MCQLEKSLDIARWPRGVRGAQPSPGKNHHARPFILGGWSVSLKGKAWESRANTWELMALSGHLGTCMAGLEGGCFEGLLWSRPSSVLSPEEATSSCHCCLCVASHRGVTQVVALVGRLGKTENKSSLAFRALPGAEDSYRPL